MPPPLTTWACRSMFPEWDNELVEEYSIKEEGLLGHRKRSKAHPRKDPDHCVRAWNWRLCGG